MSIQEYFLQNKGHLEVYASKVETPVLESMNADIVNLTAPQIISDVLKVYQWNFNLPIYPSPYQTVNGIFSITGTGQGALYIPDQATLDTYFSTSNKGVLFYIEVLNATANALSVINNGNIILNIPSGTPLNPSYSKYFFGKALDNGPYYCVNNTTNIL